jgi:hypothetical protein
MARKPTQDEINRLIVGNQVAIMRALATFAPPAHRRDLEMRVLDAKTWWRANFGQEVGFSTDLGDQYSLRQGERT